MQSTNVICFFLKFKSSSTLVFLGSTMFVDKVITLYAYRFHTSANMFEICAVYLYIVFLFLATDVNGILGNRGFTRSALN